MNATDAGRIAAHWCENGNIAADAARLQAIADALVAAHRVDLETGKHMLVDEAGSPKIVIKAGDIVDMDVGAFLTELTAKDPRKEALTRQAEQGKGSGYVRAEIGSSTGFRPAGDFFADFTAGLNKAHDAALAAEAATWPNPWAANQVNRTRQAILQNKNPALAAKFRAEAAR